MVLYKTPLLVQLALDNLDYSIIVTFDFDENHTNDKAYSHKLDDKN